MIPLEADHVAPALRLDQPDRLDHRRAVRAAIDVVAQKDELVRTACRMLADLPQQPLQEVVVPVDVADGVSQTHDSASLLVLKILSRKGSGSSMESRAIPFERAKIGRASCRER